MIRITSDTITPGLARSIRASSDPTRVMSAMGLALFSVTKRAFSNPALRASAWAPRKSGGSNSLLRKSGMLWQSIRITDLTSNSVTVGTDRIYAAIHQWGGIIRAKPGKALVFTIGGKKIFTKQVRIPARPYFPFSRSGEITPAGRKAIGDAARTTIQKMLR